MAVGDGILSNVRDVAADRASKQWAEAAALLPYLPLRLPHREQGEQPFSLSTPSLANSFFLSFFTSLPSFLLM